MDITLTSSLAQFETQLRARFRGREGVRINLRSAPVAGRILTLVLDGVDAVQVYCVALIGGVCRVEQIQLCLPINLEGELTTGEEDWDARAWELARSAGELIKQLQNDNE